MSNESFNILDKLANQSDRFLFIATLILLMVVARRVAAHFIARHDDLVKEHREVRAQHEQNMGKMIEQQNSTAKELAVVIQKNSGVIEQNTEVVTDCMAQLRQAKQYQ